MTSLQFAGKVIVYSMHPVVNERIHWRREKAERGEKRGGMERGVMNERKDGGEEHVRSTDRHKNREKQAEAYPQIYTSRLVG